MAKRIFNKREREELERNRNVVSCSSKYISYTRAFKEYALHAYEHEYRNAREIFETADFDLKVIGKDIPHQCISRWKRNGIDGKKGRRKKKVFPSLEAEIAYLKAENRFLKQLRAKRRAE